MLRGWARDLRLGAFGLLAILGMVALLARCSGEDALAAKQKAPIADSR